MTDIYPYMIPLHQDEVVKQMWDLEWECCFEGRSPSHRITVSNVLITCVCISEQAILPDRPLLLMHSDGIQEDD